MNSDKPRILASHEIQVLRRAGHAQREIATLAGVSLGSVRRVERETALTHVDSEQNASDVPLADQPRPNHFDRCSLRC